MRCLWALTLVRCVLQTNLAGQQEEHLLKGGIPRAGSWLKFAPHGQGHVLGVDPEGQVSPTELWGLPDAYPSSLLETAPSADDWPADPTWDDADPEMDKEVDEEVAEDPDTNAMDAKIKGIEKDAQNTKKVFATVDKETAALNHDAKLAGKAEHHLIKAEGKLGLPAPDADAEAMALKRLEDGEQNAKRLDQEKGELEAAKKADAPPADIFPDYEKEQAILKDPNAKIPVEDADETTAPSSFIEKANKGDDEWMDERHEDDYNTHQKHLDEIGSELTNRIAKLKKLKGQLESDKAANEKREKEHPHSKVYSVMQDIVAGKHPKIDHGAQQRYDNDIAVMDAETEHLRSDASVAAVN